MNRDQIRSAVLAQLGHIAPEADLDHLPSTVALREELDLDSVDYLNFILALHKELGVEVPEADYAQLGTLEGCVAYLARRLGV
ncbi:MAG TPA: phosphopantetheine-binding protein [Holophagaceae bacterium]|nr:phosphopantetheine-binding protein [Holophagaceae bacterium]